MNLFIYYVYVFYIYSFIGWAQEVLQSCIKKKKFINRGFLIGPICPIYGFGSMFITYFLTSHLDEPFFVFLTAIFICCSLEYFTSYILEKMFNARWWDYSDLKFNINGRICLECGLGFGLGALLVIYVINPYVIDLIFKYVDLNILGYIAFFLICIQVVDIIISFNFISKLNNISNSIKSDNTEVITQEVKKMLAASTRPYKRLLESFPNMTIHNRMSIIKDKLEERKKKYLDNYEENKKKYENVKKEIKRNRKKLKLKRKRELAKRKKNR